MTPERFLFVGDDLAPRTGEQAREALAETNDAAFVEPGRGVVRVPRERWAVAQRYERRTWMEAGAHADDDRNGEHAARFAGYAALRGRGFGRAIELGCGPFTNLRLIAGVAAIGACTLVDPLVLEYLGHPHCRYRHGRVEVGPSALAGRLGSRRALRALRRVVRAVRPGALVDGPAVERLIAAPIEELPALEPFDLVVMINVLEHCYDAAAVFSRVAALCRPGGVLVFHDKLYAADQVARNARLRYDAGHPLRIDESVINGFLEARFRTLFARRDDVADRFGDVDLSERGISFVGERLNCPRGTA